MIPPIAAATSSTGPTVLGVSALLLARTAMMSLACTRSSFSDTDVRPLTVDIASDFSSPRRSLFGISTGERDRLPDRHPLRPLVHPWRDDLAQDVEPLDLGLLPREHQGPRTDQARRGDTPRRSSRHVVPAFPAVSSQGHGHGGHAGGSQTGLAGCWWTLAIWASVRLRKRARLHDTRQDTA